MKLAFITALEIGRDCTRAVLGSKSGHKLLLFTLSEKHSDRSGYVKFSEFEGEPDVRIRYVDPKNKDDNTKMESEMAEFSPDAIFVIGWSFMIPKQVFRHSKIGAIGHHPTLLPKHRGNAPIPWALINGLNKTGVTFFMLADKPDSGPIVGQVEVPISLEDDATSLYRKISNATIPLLLKVIGEMETGKTRPTPQDERLASTWPKRRPEDGLIDWDWQSMRLYNWIRGLTHPYPGAFTYLNGKKMLVWKAVLYSGEFSGSKKTGEILSVSNGGVAVKTGDGALLLKTVQIEGDAERPAEKLPELKAGSILG